MTVNVAIQGAALRGRFPGARTEVERSGLTWTGTLQPTELSRRYKVRIRYRPPSSPHIHVLSEMPTRHGAAYPHTFNDGSLCLYETGEWYPEMLIADTIVPWTSEWLVHYEIWLATGKWYGSGEQVGRNVRVDGLSAIATPRTSSKIGCDTVTA